MSAQPLQTVVQDKCALLVQLLHEGVTKELLYKEFKKYGTIKSLKHFAKTKSAQIEFTTPEEASTAKRMLNHSQLLRKEINIVNYQNKDELKQKKKFNLFLHNVPQHLETSKLHNFMSKYGEITSLMLKKNDENLNLGYGYVQFETKEAYEKILSEHNEFGKITIVNTNDSFNVQMFNDSTKNKSNTIHIQGLFEKEVQPSESAEKAKEISAIFEKTKNQLNLSQFSYHTQYNDSKKNFWVNVDFQYEDEKQEELVYQTIKTLVKDNFSYKENQTQGPIISFKSNESSERNLFFLGVKTSKKEQDIADWIFKCIQVKVSTDNIRIKKKVINKANQANSEELHTNNVSVFFESQAHGERIMIFTSLPTNKALVDEIFEVKHKVTLFLKKTDQDSVSKLTQKMKDYQNNNFTNNNPSKIEVINPMAQYPWPPMVPNINMFMTNKTQLTNQVNIPKNKPVIPQNKEAPVAPKALPPQNIFIKFQQASQEEKKGSIEQIVTAIQTQKAEFDKIDEQSQRGILGQIIYYKISNLDFEKNDKLITYLEDVKNEAQAKAKIEEFKQAVAKITGMLIDLDVFTISDIIDIVKDEKELIERCNEAIDLINQKN